MRELVIKAQAGDQFAYKQFLEAVLKMIKPRLGKKIFKKDDVDDVAQTILISIHQNLHTYDSNRPIEPWIWTITERRIIDYIRKYTSEYKELDELTDNLVTTEDNASKLLEKDRGEIFNCLSPELKKAIKLTKVEGLSTAEAAKKLGIKENALRTRISRAMSLMKKNLDEDILHE